MPIVIYNCVRCGYEWASRLPEKPDRCAGCKTTYWWREARKTKRRQVGPIGRPHAYPAIHALEIGQSVLIPWTRDESMNAVEAPKINRAVLQEAKTYGKKFHRQGKVYGLLVTRLK